MTRSATDIAFWRLRKKVKHVKSGLVQLIGKLRLRRGPRRVPVTVQVNSDLLEAITRLAKQHGLARQRMIEIMLIAVMDSNLTIDLNQIAERLH